MDLESSTTSTTKIKFVSKFFPEKIEIPPATKELKLSISCTSFNFNKNEEKNEKIFEIEKNKKKKNKNKEKKRIKKIIDCKC